MSSSTAPDKMIDRFAEALGWQLEERASGRYELIDYGVSLRVAWDAPTPASWLLEVAVEPDEDEERSTMIELSLDHGQGASQVTAAIASAMRTL